jgi:LacI family transcriptional regulator
LPNILSYFFAQVCYGIERVADEKGYSLITCISDESYKKEVKTLEFLSAGTVDGLIISMTEETQHKNHIAHFNDIMDNKIPMVLFDRVLDAISCDKVIVDDFEAAFEATKHLLKIGCKTIVILSPLHDSSVGKLRLKGYQKALENHDILLDESHILRLKNEDSLEDSLSNLLNKKKIDGVLALDELTAVKALKVLKENRLKVPEDVSIIGFSNGRLSRYASPTLTSISQHGKLIGETAAKLLIDKIEKKVAFEVHTTKIIKTDLILRESTKS